MRVAIFTDNDFDKVNGVTTTLTAALRHVPPGLRLRVYTAEAVSVETGEYLALASTGCPIPFYREMRVYWPRFGEYVRRARADGIDLVHLTTPGPMGLAAMYVAARLRTYFTSRSKPRGSTEAAHRQPTTDVTKPQSGRRVRRSGRLLRSSACPTP